MKDLFFNFFSNLFRIYLIQAILFMLFGLLLLFSPDIILVVVSCIISFFLIIYGICLVITKETVYRNTIIPGILLISFGIILLLNTHIIATMISIMIGIYLIILGIKKIDIALKLRDCDVKLWPYKMVMAVLTIIGGIILVINPLKGAFLATKMIGIMVVIYSVIDIIDTFIFKKGIKELEDIIY